ncbi:MAG: DUF721 domain-containing protein [Treponema sp.]|nr:DUF721 domain-containing protein [Treponema sp.]
MSEIVNMQTLMEEVSVFSNSDEGKLPSLWKKVVSRIKASNEETNYLGQRLAVNTRVLDYKKGVLIIESDHSGWIQYLKFYQNFIIKGLNMENSNLKIRSFAFRLKENKNIEKEVYEQALDVARKEMEERLKKNEEEMDKFFEKNGTPPKKPLKQEDELPPELKAKFDSMMHSMLTNSEK